MKNEQINIEGMSCKHCVMRVKNALDGLKGVSTVNVEIGKVTISYDEAIIQRAEIDQAIIKSGYKVV